jgi:hypothetical protein
MLFYFSQVQVSEMLSPMSALKKAPNQIIRPILLEQIVQNK